MSRKPQRHPWPDRQQRGFTLVEIAVVVMILGLLIALTLPGYRKVTLKSKATATVNDLRVFAAAYGNFNLQYGRYPSSAIGADNRGEIGNGVSVVFTKPTPIGGSYEWLEGTIYGKAAIGISIDGNADLDLLDMIDQLMDDGNPNTGSVLAPPGSGKLVYIIEP